MKWFGYQRNSSGGRVPVLFDERPSPDWEMSAYLIWDTLKEVPLELDGASLVDLVKWDCPTSLLVERDRISELLEANNREVERRRAAEAECEVLRAVIKRLVGVAPQ